MFVEVKGHDQIKDNFNVSLYMCIAGADSEGGAPGARPPPPPKIGKNMIFLAYNRDFSHEIPQNFRASLRSAQFF